jgi:WD40 repeat protein
VLQELGRDYRPDVFLPCDVQNIVLEYTAFAGVLVQTLEGHTLRIMCLSVLADGRLVSGSWDKTLRVWDPASGLCLHELKGHTDCVNCVTVLADGCLVSGSDDETLRVWS